MDGASSIRGHRGDFLFLHGLEVLRRIHTAKGKGEMNHGHDTTGTF